MAYITIRQNGEDEFIEKKSEFIGYAKRCETEEEAKEFINDIKSKHKQATHNCSAYIIGENKNIQRYNDDGEPQGTAGIPILEVLKKNNVTDCAIVVTRYYGGIMLGAGGLTRAYTKGASIALNSGGIVEKVKGLELKLSMEYDLLGKIQYLFNKNNWHIENIEYEDKVFLYVLVENDLSLEVINEVNEASNGKIEIKKSDISTYFKEGNRLYLNF